MSREYPASWRWMHNIIVYIEEEENILANLRDGVSAPSSRKERGVIVLIRRFSQSATGKVLLGPVQLPLPYDQRDAPHITVWILSVQGHSAHDFHHAMNGRICRKQRQLWCRSFSASLVFLNLNTLVISLQTKVTWRKHRHFGSGPFFKLFVGGKERKLEERKGNRSQGNIGWLKWEQYY